LIRYFDKTTELLAGESQLLDQSPVWIQKEFTLSTDNAAYDSCPVDDSNVHIVRTIVPPSISFDFDA
jgi:hypothetical protein